MPLDSFPVLLMPLDSFSVLLMPFDSFPVLLFLISPITIGKGMTVIKDV